MSEFLEEVTNATRRHGFNPIVGDIFKKQQEWFSWFRGDVNGFHTFKQKINGTAKKFHRNTMNMPKKVCEDYHSLLWNENCDIKINDKEANKIVHDVLYMNNFETEFGNLLELSLGMGLGYMVEYLYDNETKIDFIPFEDAVPLGFDNGQITSLVTIDRKRFKDYWLTHLTYHYIEDGSYNVKHETYISDDKSSLGKNNNRYLSMVFDDVEINEEYTIKFETSKPFFQTIRPNVKNHYNIHQPHGVSVYATMLDLFRTVDILFDMYETEAQGNRTRIVVNSKVTETKMEANAQGDGATYVNYFDENDTTFVALPLGDDNEDIIKLFKGQMSYDQLGLAIDKILKIIGFRSGLGRNYYSFDEGEIYQNEKNVIVSNSDTYRGKKKHEIILRRAVEDLARSILRLESIAGRYKGDVDKLEIDVIFDDSLAMDDETINEKYKELGTAGYIPKWMVVERMLNVSPDEAKAIVKQAEADERERQQAYLSDYDE